MYHFSQTKQYNVALRKKTKVQSQNYQSRKMLLNPKP